MSKKNKRRCEKRIVFSIVCSLLFREKACKSHAKRMITMLQHKNRQKITRGKLLFSKKTLFSNFLGFPWVPRGVLGRPGKFLKSLIFLIHGQLRLKTTVDGLREASGRPPDASRRPQGWTLRRFLDQFCTSETNKKMQKV